MEPFSSIVITLHYEVVGGFHLAFAYSTQGIVVSSHGFSVFSKVAVASYVLKVLFGLIPLMFSQGYVKFVISFRKHILGVPSLNLEK